MQEFPDCYRVHVRSVKPSTCIKPMWLLQPNYPFPLYLNISGSNLDNYACLLCTQKADMALPINTVLHALLTQLPSNVFHFWPGRTNYSAEKGTDCVEQWNTSKTYFSVHLSARERLRLFHTDGLNTVRDNLNLSNADDASGRTC